MPTNVTRPTLREMDAMIRRGHHERAAVVARFLAWLRGRLRPGAKPATLRPA